MKKTHSDAGFGMIVLKNFKIEITLVGIAIIVFFVLLRTDILRESIIANAKELNFDNLSSVLSAMVTFFSITCAMFLTSITIIATSVLNISRSILESKIDKPILVVFIVGMILNLITAFICTLGPLFCEWWYFYFLILLILCSLISFARLTICIYRLFVANMAHMAMNMDKEERISNDKRELLRRIEENTRK